MENFTGATRVVPETTDEYTKMGQRLTAESARRLHGKCINCGESKGTTFLMHLSVMSDGIVSFMACEKCTKQMTAFDLFVPGATNDGWPGTPLSRRTANSCRCASSVYLMSLPNDGSTTLFLLRVHGHG